jgi:hypothetical protein
MARLLMVLAAPRSFSSLVSTMVGQHPEIYGFPEINLMMRDTVAEALAWERSCGRFLGSPGLLRTLAQLLWGDQSAEHVLDAALYLEDRADWTTKAMMDHVMDLAAAASGARFCLEKSPSLTFLPPGFARLRAGYPDAMYIHVTRNPVSLTQSLEEYIRESQRFTPEQKEMRLRSAITAWPVTQRNILDFCAGLAPGQYLRIRGEDVLENGALVMGQVAEWLGLRRDAAAIAAMLRPEDSPYARLGPVNAPFGNDPKFVMSPAFRPGKPRLPRVADFLNGPEGAELGPERRAYLQRLSHLMGYS